MIRWQIKDLTKDLLRAASQPEARWAQWGALTVVYDAAMAAGAGAPDRPNAGHPSRVCDHPRRCPSAFGCRHPTSSTVLGASGVGIELADDSRAEPPIISESADIQKASMVGRF